MKVGYAEALVKKIKNNYWGILIVPGLSQVQLICNSWYTEQNTYPPNKTYI